MREDAEDLVQDVLVALYRALYNDKTVKDIEHYLLRSLSNICVDYYRRKKMSIVTIEEARDVLSDADRELYEEYLRIKVMLDDLPYEQAEVVRLKCYDELTFRQIALLQDISEATVKSRYKYAIRHLKERYNSDV